MSDDEEVIFLTTKTKTKIKKQQIESKNNDEITHPNLTVTYEKLSPNEKTDDDIWQQLFDEIEYTGDPFNSAVQANIHHLYNSLNDEQQKEWLHKTSGLGWSDKYIRIALTFWYVKGEYCNRTETEVKEYLNSLTPLERSNFNDICQSFSPEDPYVHIKESCGFIAYKQQKKDIQKYIDTLDDTKIQECNKNKKSSYPKFHTYMLKTPEFTKYLKNIECMKKFIASNILSNEENKLYNQLSDSEKYHYLLSNDKFNIWLNKK